MTHENFLAMLKGQKDDEKVMEEFESATLKTKSNDALKKGKTGSVQAPSSSSGNSGSGSVSTGRTGITWNALKDDYPLAGQSMALKVSQFPAQISTFSYHFFCHFLAYLQNYIKILFLFIFYFHLC